MAGYCSPNTLATVFSLWPYLSIVECLTTRSKISYDGAQTLKMVLSTIRVATAHISPHLLSKRLSTQKTIAHIELAAQHGARLVCFPESSIPGFPIWASLLPPSHNSTHDFFRRFVEESVSVTQDEVNAIKSCARKHRISVSLGISEKLRHNTGTIFNTNLLISEKGEIAVHHRKLACTWFEKLLWSHGDGSGLRVMHLRGDDRVRVGALVSTIPILVVNMAMVNFGLL